MGHGCCGGHESTPDHGNVQAPAATVAPPVSADVLTLTEKAAVKIKDLLAAEKKGPEYGLRVGVQGGGCSGLSYVMDFDTARPDDTVIDQHGVKVFVDPKSTMYIRGTALEYADGLTGSGFTMKNPNVKSSCGCGSSFST